MIPTWLFLMPLDLIHETSKKYGLDPKLVTVIVKKESSGASCATRYEPAWKWTYNARQFALGIGITADTEEVHQATSWGLMQVMGTVARELGFHGHLVELCEPRKGLKYGCLKLKQLLERYGKTEDAVSAYNQGSPRKTRGGLYLNEKTYVDPVMRAYRNLGLSLE